MKDQHTTHNIKPSNKNSEVIKKHFSHCFDKEGALDFHKLKQELSNTAGINFAEESYRMDWLGRSYARLLARDEATTLLQEDKAWNTKQENKTSQNLLIKGDNLEVLKHLCHAYHEKIKMIYIDPPYNTGSDGFVYHDDRKFTADQLAHLAGINEDQAERILEFTKSNSNSHSAWLTFMYPRLYIAKQLLKDDGVIFASIDDNEVAQLRMIMDEIFGEDNFLAELIWKKKQGGGNDSKNIVSEHEYILCYSKSTSILNLLPDENHELSDNLYPNRDEKGDYGLIRLDKSSIGGGDSLRFEITGPNGEKYFPRTINGKDSRWRWGKKKVQKDYDKLVFKNGGVYTKYYRPEGIIAKSLCVSPRFGRTETGNDEIKELFNGLKPFEYPKPTKLIRHILHISVNTNDIILDFFAGSGTTGDAVMQLNAEDGGKRQYMLVQLPEKIDPKKNKTAYDFVQKELGTPTPTIFDITKERILRAGKKIQEDNKQSKKPKDLSTLDTGFKVFETIPIWEDYDVEADSFDPQIQLFDKNTLRKEDLQTLLTTWKTYDGISLTQSPKPIDLDGYTGHYVSNKLYLIDSGFKTKHLKRLLEDIDQKKDFNPATIIVFGYNFQSKVLKEVADNVKNYANKKHITIDYTIRY